MSEDRKTSAGPFNALQIDAALDAVQRTRAAVMVQPASVERSLQLAHLADVEATWWEELVERSVTRVYWRAALMAREHALHAARAWRQLAATQPVCEPVAGVLPKTAAVA